MAAIKFFIQEFNDCKAFFGIPFKIKERGDTMEVIETKVSLVALTFDEIQTIISALETDFYEWNIEEAGILLGQFKKAKENLINKK